MEFIMSTIYYVLLIANPMGRNMVRLKSFRNNLEILSRGTLIVFFLSYMEGWLVGCQLKNQVFSLEKVFGYRPFCGKKLGSIFCEEKQKQGKQGLRQTDTGKQVTTTTLLHSTIRFVDTSPWLKDVDFDSFKFFQSHSGEINLVL